MRDGSLPDDRPLLAQLYKEAAFFKLYELQRAIEDEKVCVVRLSVSVTVASVATYNLIVKTMNMLSCIDSCTYKAPRLARRITVNQRRTETQAGNGGEPYQSKMTRTDRKKVEMSSLWKSPMHDDFYYKSSSYLALLNQSLDQIIGLFLCGSDSRADKDDETRNTNNCEKKKDW